MGPEAIAGSTRLKAGTATKMPLYLLSTASMIGLGKVCGNLMVEVRAANDALAERTVRSEVARPDAEQTGRLLREMGRRGKPAIVMAALGVPLDEAEQRLAEAGGLLRSCYYASMIEIVGRR